MPTRNNSDKRKNPFMEQMAGLRRLLHTSRGKDILLFLFFLCVSYAFWLIMQLNDNVQRDFQLPLQITNVPPNVKIITEVPPTISVSVRDKGITLAHASYGSKPAVSIKYPELDPGTSQDRKILSRQLIQARVRENFSNTAEIISTTPDSLTILVTDREPIYVNVSPDIDISTVPQCDRSGNVTVSPEKVAVYMASNAKSAPAVIRTERLVRTGLKDTLRVELKLLHDANILVEPDIVTVTIPVEPLVSKTSDTPIRLVNKPADRNVVLFPSKVKVSYLIPMSYNNAEPGAISVTADYRKRSQSKIPLTISGVPDRFSAVQLLTDSVEYLIEQ